MIIRAATVSRVSSEASIEYREGLLDQLQAWSDANQDGRVGKMMNLVLDGFEPSVQLFNGATETKEE